MIHTPKKRTGIETTIGDYHADASDAAAQEQAITQLFFLTSFQYAFLSA
jgi:hypothetical protein